jgi:hypothetical protein
VIFIVPPRLQGLILGLVRGWSPPVEYVRRIAVTCDVMHAVRSRTRFRISTDQKVRAQVPPGALYVTNRSDSAFSPHRRPQSALNHADASCPVGWPEGVSPSGSHRSGRNSLPLPGSCHPGYQTAGGVLIQAQWAKNRGYRWVTPIHAFCAFLRPRNRRYLLRTHRNR